MNFFCNNSIIVLIFSIAILMLSLWVNVSLARTLPHTHPPSSSSSSSLDHNNMSSSSSSSQTFSHSKQGPNSAHDQPAMVAASLRRIPPSRPNPTQNRLRPGARA
ncbi:uncharacterized protein LOC129315129 [Prosopis cineraria]|uniref:uncharacterized protein LOC129315129 n=1 Tax=Prosopis cineraria TaxID=364024 RepID=UPI00240F050F|nr:uncharacterized protein LOC129315129 [Prosopis cineraria]